jgi:hypothetical protein
MTLETNVATRKEALAFIALGDDTAATLDAKRFWLAVSVAAMDRAGLTQQEVDPTPKEHPMTDDEAKLFGRKTIGFGKHCGERWDAVPLDYLEWLDSTQWSQAKELHRYVGSAYVQREINDD